MTSRSHALEGRTLGPARQADASAIARMSRTEIEWGLPWRWRPRDIAALIADPETEVVVARVGPRVSGFAVMTFRFERRAAHLVLLAVDPDQRRSGLGRALVLWLEKMARLGGIAEIALELRAGNRGGLAFYRALDYAVVGRARGYYQGREDAVRMRRSLLPRS